MSEFVMSNKITTYPDVVVFIDQLATYIAKLRVTARRWARHEITLVPNPY
jgi:hypothetical protein